MAALAAAIDGRREAPAADRLPTLTEVVELGPPATAALLFGVPTARTVVSVAGDSAPPPTADIDGLSRRVLAELQPRIELLLETRLREALAPALAQAADGLIRNSREQLADILKTLVHEAVARVLERQRSS